MIRTKGERIQCKMNNEGNKNMGEGIIEVIKHTVDDLRDVSKQFGHTRFIKYSIESSQPKPATLSARCLTIILAV